jgi:hypothetical protein
MKNDNLTINKYKYNNIHYGENDNEYVLEINKIANDLYSTSKNKKNYNLLITNLNNEIMGEAVSDEETDIITAEPSYEKSKLSRLGNDNNYISYKQSNTISTTYTNNITTARTMSAFNSPQVNSYRVKKYTDVHANSKYYYPNTLDSYDELDFLQWNDRSNRIKYYGKHKDQIQDTNELQFKHYSKDYKNY